MCVVSMVMDTYTDRWRELQTQPLPYTIQPAIFLPPEPAISAKEIAEFRDLLNRAREYDKRRGEPDCELDSKRQAVKTIAAELGVEIDFL